MSSKIAVLTSTEKFSVTKLVTLLLTMTLMSSFAFAQDDEEYEVEDIVITATKRESTLQEAPLAVTALSGTVLNEKGIVNALNLQFSVPNMLYSKSNFSGSNFVVRGIGNNAVAASSDGGVGIHFNGAYLVAPVVFESEFFDIERVEVLRGPQGTLYGRNTTAGVMNLIPNKPKPDGYHGEAKLESTDYNGRRITSVANLPIIKNFLQFRIAYQSHKRDGLIYNQETENFIDDRNTRSFRYTMRIGGAPDSPFELTVTRERFNEKDSRLRTSKQICHKDRSNSPNNLGCLPGQSLYSDTVFGTPATFATLAGFLTNVYPHALAGLVPSAFGQFLYPNGVDVGFNCEVFGTENCRYAGTLDKSLYDPSKDNNVDDLREINEHFDPYYETSNDLRVANLKLDLGDAFTLNVLSTEQVGAQHTNTDYNHAASTYTFDPTATAISNGILTAGGVTTSAFLFTNDPISTGHGQSVNNRNTLVGFDVTQGNNTMRNSELRLNSNFDGGFNFLFGLFDLEYESAGVYEVHSNGLQFLSLQAPELGYYKNETSSYRLTSSATYGELYFEGQTARLTLGFRSSEETKRTVSRQTLLNSATAQFLPGVSGLSSLNSASPFGGYGGNGNGAVPDFTTLENSWDEPSTKLSVDFLGESSLVFITLANSYKSGGLNPPAFTGAFPQIFEPEYIDSLEIGGKNSYGANKKNYFNWTLFHYDYEGLQTSKIIDRTSVNENIDAVNQGVEFEWNHHFTPNFAMLITASYLNTEIGDSESINTADPANYYAYYDVQDDGTVQLKDANNVPVFINTKNGDASVYLTPNADYEGDYVFSQDDCDIYLDGGKLTCSSIYTAAPNTRILTGNSTAQNAASFVAATPVFYNTETKEYFVSSSDLTYDRQVTIEDLVGTQGEYRDLLPAKLNVPIGISLDLEGNQLPNAPEASTNVNLRWFGEVDGNKLTFNIEYYWQSEFYTRIYNTPQDLIQAWDVVNMSLSLTDKRNQWSMNFYVRNSLDKDYITGTYFTGPASGNFTNVFLLDPKTYGANLRVSF